MCIRNGLANIILATLLVRGRFPLLSCFASASVPEMQVVGRGDGGLWAFGTLCG